mmetsp:Transcript_54742/g.168662  ORF Transcript_54742/g.168662 Transcript_54742/m.168662 type:complete len:205 (-) Transcript_54742:114-728(-)
MVALAAESARQRSDAEVEQTDHAVLLGEVDHMQQSLALRGENASVEVLLPVGEQERGHVRVDDFLRHGRLRLPTRGADVLHPMRDRDRGIGAGADRDRAVIVSRLVCENDAHNRNLGGERARHGKHLAVRRGHETVGCHVTVELGSRVGLLGGLGGQHLRRDGDLTLRGCLLRLVGGGRDDRGVDVLGVDGHDVVNGGNGALVE